MNKEKISILIPFYNNSSFIKDTIEYIKDDIRINEIIINDDYSTEKEFGNLKEIVGDIDKIKIYRNKENLGVYLNKLKTVSYSNNEWGVLLDSDNIISKEYIDKIYEELPWDKNILYCPDNSITFPGIPSKYLNFTKYSNLIINNQNILKYIHQQLFRTFLNDGNYFINTKEFYKTMIKYFQNYRPFYFVSCCDVIVANTDWLIDNNNHKIKIVKGMNYLHRLHKNSVYVTSTRNKEEYYYRLSIHRFEKKNK